jgi:integrase/recombinase XerD
MPAPAKSRFCDDEQARAQLQERLRTRGHLLTDRERDILRSRAALGDDKRLHTYAELALRHGVSTARTREIEKLALAKLERGLAAVPESDTALTEADLDPERPGVVGELIPLHGTGTVMTLAQARAALLSRYVRTGDRLRQLMASWLATLNSPNTRAAYLRDITQYLDFCIERDLDPLGVRIQDFTLYREHLARHTKRDDTPYTLSTRQRKVATVSSFYRFLADVDAIDRSPVTSAARFNQKPDPPDKSLTVEETLRLVEDAETGHHTLGSRCAALIVELLFTMGLRVSELCSLNIDQLTHVKRDGKLYRGIRFIGKGNKTHDRAIPEELHVRRLVPYLEGRPQPTDPRAALALLVTVDGKRVDRKQIYRLVRRVHERGLIGVRPSPHWGRHTFTIRALELGYTLEQVQRALGHSSIVTTQSYVRTRNNVINDPSHVVATALYAIRGRDTAPTGSDIPDKANNPGGAGHGHVRRSA